MSLLDAISSFFGGARKKRQEEHEEFVKQAFQARCKHFRAVLSANKRALGAMANLEDAMRGEKFFNMSYVRSQCTILVTNVYNMVRDLNALSNNAHEDLNPRLKELQQKIQELLAPRVQEKGAPLVLNLKHADFTHIYEVGSKMASLGEAFQQMGQPIPAGFVVTATAFSSFLEHNDLLEEISRQLQMADLTLLDNVFKVSERLQKLIKNAELPEELVEAVKDELAKLELPENTRFAVRSSAIGEDSHGSSFAGQFRSELNIPGSQLIEAYKSIIASKYSVTAMTYRLNRGIPDDEMPMSVGVMAMVDANAGGVAYSRDPLNKNGDVIINAVPGLPKTVVDGTTGVDVFHVSREVPHEIVDKTISMKDSKTVCHGEEGILEMILEGDEREEPALTDEQVLEVAKVTLGMEVFYGLPQDVEWAYNADDQFILLQSRPLLDDEKGSKATPEPYTGENKLLAVGGVCVSSGIAAGKVFKVRRESDMLEVPENAILVVENAHSRWAPVLNKVLGVVAETGGKAGHLASVAREYGIPALFGVHGACRNLKPEAEVTIDADNGRIIEGIVPDLPKAQKPRTLFVGSPIHKRLGKLVPFIVPLNLLDPSAPEFAPESCRTLHDIIRYCHEKAVEEMFRIDSSIFSERCGKQLRYKGSALQYYVVDIDDGFCSSVNGRYVDMRQICCKGMIALWDGMLAVPYVPHSTSGRGFFSVVAESACNPELEITSASKRFTRNYFLINRDYCNLQASFGYHFCTVETQAGENPHENFVSFHFKGGAANLLRRKLRVEALSDVLEDNGFIVDLREDTLSAVVEGLGAEKIYRLLNILGYLLIHSRQIDATLSGEDSKEAFAEMLTEGIEKTLRKYKSPIIHDE